MKRNNGFIAMELVVSVIVVLSAISIYKVATRHTASTQSVSQASNADTQTTPFAPTGTPSGFDDTSYQQDFDTAVSFIKTVPEIQHMQEVIARNGHTLSYEPEGEDGNLFTVSVFETSPNGEQRLAVDSFEVDIVKGEVFPIDLPKAERIPLQNWKDSVNSRFK